MNSTQEPRPKHLGRNLRRMREILGVKQETIAEGLGVTQQTVSNIEGNEKIEEKTLDKIAGILGISSEAIKSLDEDQIVYNIQHNHDNSNSGATGLQVNQPINCTFNPIDKWVEAVEENKRLYEELLKSERGKVAALEKALEGRK